MKALKNPLLLATLSIVLLGMAAGQSVFWLRVGGDGLTYVHEDRRVLKPLEAKTIVPSKRFNMKYDPNKEYRITEKFQVNIKRGMFPFTYEEKLPIDVPYLKWDK